MDEITDPLSQTANAGDMDVAGPSARVRHLLDEARAAFVAEGFGGVSIDEIARRAGVSKETIYRHFPDKPALFRAALTEFEGRFALRTAALGQVEAPIALQEMARAICDTAVEGGLLSPLWLAAGLAGHMPDFARELQQAQWQRLEPLREALAAHARARGLVIAVPMALALDFGSLAVEGPAQLLGFALPPAQQRKRLAVRVAALFEGGLQALSAQGAMPDRSDEVYRPSAPSPEHLRRLLDVSATHFLGQGYEATNLAALGAQAQVGRGTLYRHFGSKEGLFAATLRDLATQVAQSARVPALPDRADVSALARFLFAAIGNLGGSPSLELHRTAISSSRREPTLAREVHDTVRAPWLRPLTAWIANLTGLPDAQWLARQTLVLALQGSRLFAMGTEQTVEEAQHHAERSAQIILHGYIAMLNA